MDRKKIERKVKEILEKILNIPQSQIKLDSKLEQDLKMDSFSAIEIMYEIEDKFGIETSEKDLSPFKTVRDIVAYIATNLKRK